MGRGRGKGKKQLSIAAREDAGSGDEEKLPVRRRGRPQKPLKDDIEEDEDVEKIEEEEEEDSESAKSSVLNKDSKNQPAVENGRKRKRASQVKENLDSIKEENGVGNKTNTNEAVKSVGFRQNGSRRKNKPRRAAEVGVECR
ncbi:mitotic apparatus protein p62-like [Coffea eugenioides]|uniref:mitotic apparatus protein p62-like n=1 Tax=Coffea eugenioides TaxID=49369 RepID=UPI000F608C66|nr:mitotic apparatus protein p62-like [Coffea eugenioides]XP_027173150.1 mitotic apparatus protein p62-like [Coffea eugenioides]